MSDKEISAAEVAEHNSKDSPWIIIDGYVYDVSEWQKDHPGGKRILQKNAGKDASKQFHKYHDVETVMRKFGVKYRIGKLAPGDVVANKTSALELVPTNSQTEDVEPIEDFGDLIPFADPMWYQGFYSPYYTNKHAKIRNRIREWVDEHVAPFIDDWEAKGEIPEQLYRDFGEAGWLSFCTGSHLFPSKFTTNKHADICPDIEYDAFAGTLVIDEVCRAGSGSLIWFLSGGFGIGLPPVINYAAPDVQQKVIPDVIAGKKRICLAITEPRGGSDVADLETSAVKTPDGKHYIVNGEKKWITNGLWADYFSVAVRTGGPGMNGVSMLLIEKTMPGVSVRKISTQGMRCSGSSFIELNDVKVPVGNLIGEENKGFKVIVSNFNHERIGIIVQAVRFSRVCFEEAIKWSFQRETFGQKLFKHAVIRQKLAQMGSKIEAAQASLDYLVYQDQFMDAELASIKLGGQIAALKAFSTQTFEYVAREASQIFGGLAYTVGGKGGKVERLYRDVRALAIPGGSEEIMLDLAIRQSVKVQQMYGAKL